MGGEREQLESVEEILMGDEGELLILGEELLEEGEEEGETWISRTLVMKHRVGNISKFSSYRAPLSSQDILCRNHSALHLHNAHKGQFLQGGKNGRLMSFFFLK